MVLVRDLYSPKFDFPEKEDEPRKTIMLATIPRTGSTHFGICMWSEGVFGAPLEYLNINTNRQIFARLSHGSQHRYWREIRRLRQGANGVFSYKMFIANYLHFRKHHPAFLEEIAPKFVVYLTREDKIAQAISYARAIQTRRWFAAVPDRAEPEYSFHAIRRQLRSIASQEQSWESIFELTGTTPLRVTYEGLLNDRAGVMRGLAQHVGERLEGGSKLEIGSIDKQADGISDEWRERYLDDVAAHNVPLLGPSEPSSQ